MGTTDLVCAESYERDFVIFLVEKITEALGSLYFKVVVVVTVLVFVSLAAYLNYARKKAEKMQKIHRRTKR